MIRVVPGDVRVSRWVARQIEGGPVDWGPHASLAVVRDGEVLAGIVYSEKHGDYDIRASIATRGPGWATRGVMRALFDYPFEQVKVRRITCLIAAGNVKSQTLCEKMGFTLEGIHPCAWDGQETALSYGLLRENCKWV